MRSATELCPPLAKAGLLLCLAALLGAGCAKKKSSSPQAAPVSFQIAAMLSKPDGSPAGDVRVYLPGDSEPATVTDATGSFSIAMSDERLAAIQAAYGDLGLAGETDYQLVFQQGEGEAALVGRSDPLALGDARSKDLGIIGLTKPTTLTGRVNVGGGTTDAKAAPNVTVMIDRSAAQTDGDGNFSLTGLAAGSARIHVRGSDTAVTTVLVTLKATPTLALDFPLQVYRKNSIDGLLIAVPQAEGEAAVPGRPNQRDFRVMRTVGARFMRYGDDGGKLRSSVPWQPVSDLVSFNFPQDGANTLHYQFADAKRAAASGITTVDVAANPFADSTGITIGDGSGTVPSRNVTVRVDLPEAATEMRISENIADLAATSTLPFIKVRPEVSYVFTVQRSPENAESKMVETMLRTLYCQFRSASGAVSPAFKATTRITPFPDTLTSEEAFTIGDGSGKVSGVKVPIRIGLPANAFEMRIWEEDKTTQIVAGGIITVTGGREQLQKVFFPVADRIDFLFNTTGHKTMFLQFRDVDGITSSIYRQNVLVGALQSVDVGFTINDGSPVSVTRELEIKLNLPAGAAAYRLSEDPVALGNLPFDIPPESKIVSFVTAGTGLRTLYLQYGDAVNNASKTYTASVTVDPFNGDPGSFIINGGEPLTQFPEAVLNIRPPVTAAQMEITRAVGGPNVSPFCGSDTVVTLTASATFNRWAAISDHFDVWLPAVGPSFYCIRFRNLAGDVGPFVVQHIIYDPFPVDLGGVVIVKNEDGTVSQRDVTLGIKIPPRARAMRIASSLAALPTTPFRELGESVNWYFAKPGPAGDDRYFEVFVQFVTENGDLSTVYSDNALLEIFPIERLVAELSVAGVTDTKATLAVALTPPLAAAGIKIADSLAGLATASTVAVETTSSFVVDPTPGDKTLYFKYVTADNVESSHFSATTTVSAPPSSPPP